jgi:hypothetical protein
MKFVRERTKANVREQNDDGQEYRKGKSIEAAKIPIPAEHQIVAAVLRPRTLPPS